MTTSGSVSGVELVVTGELRRRPRVLRDGQELPRDHWGTYQFDDGQGRPRPLEVSYSFWELRPRLRVGDQTVHFGQPLPLGLRIALLAFVVVAGFGGLLGFVLALASTGGSLALLRRPNRRLWHVLAAAALPVLAVVVYVLLVNLLSSER